MSIDHLSSIYHLFIIYLSSIYLSIIHLSSIFHLSIIYQSSIYNQSIYHQSIIYLSMYLSIYLSIYLSSTYNVSFIYQLSIYHLTIIYLSSIYLASLFYPLSTHTSTINANIKKIALYVQLINTFGVICTPICRCEWGTGTRTFYSCTVLYIIHCTYCVHSLFPLPIYQHFNILFTFSCSLFHFIPFVVH